MNLVKTLTVLLLSVNCNLTAQSFTSYFTGDTADVQSVTTPGVCLMGGASEHDEAMRWFLNRSGGGDIVVIRTSGSNGYNNYLYSSLGVSVNSVETILFHQASAAQDPYVKRRLQEAEAIWIAGGNQAVYLDYWQNTAVDSAVNALSLVGPVGGTSAGMAILGGHYFSASNGTVTSSQALADPYNSKMTIGHSDFMEVPWIQNVITDSHYDDPDRKGRHLTFLARVATDLNQPAFGIACNEYTAVCIDGAGMARVFGDYPNYEEHAWFLQSNCVDSFLPETCLPGMPLLWNRNQEAVKVAKIPGTPTGINTFDLNNWEVSSANLWENWYVDGQLYLSSVATGPNCGPLSVILPVKKQFKLYPQPVSDVFYLEGLPEEENLKLKILDLYGRNCFEKIGIENGKAIELEGFSRGVYLIQIEGQSFRQIKRIVVN